METKQELVFLNKVIPSSQGIHQGPHPIPQGPRLLPLTLLGRILPLLLLISRRLHSLLVLAPIPRVLEPVPIHLLLGPVLIHLLLEPVPILQLLGPVPIHLLLEPVPILQLMVLPNNPVILLSSSMDTLLNIPDIQTLSLHQGL